MSSLRQGIERLGLDSRLIGPLEAYLEELELWNRRRDLVNASGEQLVIKHVLDSLAGAPFISALPHDTLADVGSGAGFPGIPLALCFEEAAVSLIERSAKRASFLRDIILLLDLKERVEVIERDLTEIEARYSVVTFRAFRELESFAALLFELTNEHGSVVAYKGRRSVVERELSAIDDLVERSEVHPVAVPGLAEERTIVLIRPRRPAGHS